MHAPIINGKEAMTLKENMRKVIEEGLREGKEGRNNIIILLSQN